MLNLNFHYSFLFVSRSYIISYNPAFSIMLFIPYLRYFCHHLLSWHSTSTWSICVYTLPFLSICEPFIPISLTPTPRRDMIDTLATGEAPFVYNVTILERPRIFMWSFYSIRASFLPVTKLSYNEYDCYSCCLSPPSVKTLAPEQKWYPASGIVLLIWIRFNRNMYM